MENSPSLASLLCDENPTSLDEEQINPVTQDDEEYLKVLLDKEINGDGLQMQESFNVVNGNWIKGARLDAVQYIVNTSRERFAFKFRTAFLAIGYLDKFLSRKTFENEQYWAVRLAAIACLSLAAKMEERLVPNLAEFPGEDHIFDNKIIQKMELSVLRALEWRMQKLTPFAFTNFFISKFCQNRSIRDVTSRAEEVILVAIRDEKIMHHRPSAIAAAATLLITDPSLTIEALGLKINTLSLGGYLQIENVLSFYNQMKEHIEKLKSSNGDMSPPSPSMIFQRTGTIENSSVVSAHSAKRKSLTFYGGETSDPKRPC